MMRTLLSRLVAVVFGGAALSAECAVCNILVMPSCRARTCHAEPASGKWVEELKSLERHNYGLSHPLNTT